jgi:HSP20 family molecular chaperone IbpA
MTRINVKKSPGTNLSNFE